MAQVRLEAKSMYRVALRLGACRLRLNVPAANFERKCDAGLRTRLALAPHRHIHYKQIALPAASLAFTPRWSPRYKKLCNIEGLRWWPSSLLLPSPHSGCILLPRATTIIRPQHCQYHCEQPRQRLSSVGRCSRGDQRRLSQRSLRGVPLQPLRYVAERS